MKDHATHRFATFLIVAWLFITAFGHAAVNGAPAGVPPRINGASVIGVWPGTPLLHVVAASGERPMTFAADNLPPGISLDPDTGCFTGTIGQNGSYLVTVRAKNAVGQAEQRLRIEVGETLCLTPPMGWCSWNGFGDKINEQLIREIADAMATNGMPSFEAR